MIIGVPREIKNNERRVGVTPGGVSKLVSHGHRVLVETRAGKGSGFADQDYRDAGARVVGLDEVWQAELVVKVKEPIEPEFARMRKDQVLFTYLHLAASPECTKALCDAGVVAIGYETVRAADGSLPLLTPMSEVAGRLATMVGAYHLMSPYGGGGALMGGVAGVPRANVVILGGGVAGTQAAANALGLGAEVTVIDLSVARLRQLETEFGGRIRTRTSTEFEIADCVSRADLVIGAVLVPGAAAPKLVTDEMIRRMRPGSVLVDIAIDQGGCFEGSRPTTHDKPTYPVHGSLFYCVANMPGAVPATSTRALTNVTLPYVLSLADQGWRAAVERDPALAAGLNVADGRVVLASIAN
jgi:alanine dehydrogenase